MRVLLANTGTRGDVEPLLALAEALVGCGHAVAIAVEEPYRGHVEQAGLRFVATGEPTTEDAYQDAARVAMRASDPMARANAVIERWLVPRIALEGRGSGSGAPGLRLARRGLPCSPSCSRHCAGYDFAPPAIVGVYMPAAPDVLRRLDRRGIPSLFAWRNRSVMALDPYAAPSSCKRPATGFAAGRDHCGHPPRWTPFLAAGPPPVIFTFGSMTGFHAAQLDRAIAEAVRQGGWRAIVHVGSGGIGASLRASPGILCVDEMDPERLFPRAAAVVHHGGSGTTAAVLRAGKPSVVVPVWGDQQLWADALLAAGAASATLDLGSIAGVTWPLRSTARPRTRASARSPAG